MKPYLSIKVMAAASRSVKTKSSVTTRIAISSHPWILRKTWAGMSSRSPAAAKRPKPRCGSRHKCGEWKPAATNQRKPTRNASWGRKNVSAKNRPHTAEILPKLLTSNPAKNRSKTVPTNSHPKSRPARRRKPKTRPQRWGMRIMQTNRHKATNP